MEPSPSSAFDCMFVAFVFDKLSFITDWPQEKSPDKSKIGIITEKSAEINSM